MRASVHLSCLSVVVAVLFDVQFIAAPALASVHVTVDATNVVRAADARWLGLNAAAWDSNLDSDSTVSALTDLGTRVLRWPGGVWGDFYHGMNEAWNTGATNARNWGSFTTNFIHVATNLHAQVYMIANYGTSTPQEAADWVRFCNVTNHAGFKYWEIGNENFGSWEYDSNNIPPYQPHDPWTYAVRFWEYYTLMKAADPTIKIGAVVINGEDNYANNRNHVAINPRTGLPHYGWTPVMLATLNQLNLTPDFLIFHYYPEWYNPPYQYDNDSTLLQSSANWAAFARDLRQQLTDYLGPATTNVELVCTENNGDSGSQGKQSTSLVDALYVADSLSQLMKTEFNAFLWWDLRNGPDTSGDTNSSLYGWRNYGDMGIMYGRSVFYPTYYGLKLMRYFVGPGDSVLSATGNSSLLSSYAVRRANGDLNLLVINKYLGSYQDTQITLSNFIPASTAMVRSYGIPQDDAVRTNNTTAGAQDIATNSFTSVGTDFTYAFPPYSLTLFTFTPFTVPVTPQLTALPMSQQPAGKFVFQLQGQDSYPFVIEQSTNLTTWTPVSTNMLAGGALYITNTVPPGSARQFWRAVWKP